ncbi:type III-B CRISPR module RAMP protein Cmr4 [Microcoleus sp. herbarium12]|uniref:type III-B CRISPR module RAMP protein Cmr4 n=1 Tax=Microcoleus sp. herbarium12 TaxID=3055437 RepID=UPI002FD7695A
MTNLAYLYLLSPLHTGGTSQEGNIVGIAREAHTNFPYLPSSSIRGRLRSNVEAIPNNPDSTGDLSMDARIRRVKLFGPDLKDIQDSEFVEHYEYEIERKITQLEQGSIWIGDASLLWIPVPSISHGVVWISCPMLLQRWTRLNGQQIDVPEGSRHLTTAGNVYLKDTKILAGKLKDFPADTPWTDFVPNSGQTSITQVLVVPNRYCETLIEMSLWRQVKVKLNEHKAVTDGSFRYEEAIPPDSLMYFPWGVTKQVAGDPNAHEQDFQNLLNTDSVLQLGGQESLGRGFVQQLKTTETANA